MNIVEVDLFERNSGEKAPFHLVFYGDDIYQRLTMIGDENVGGGIVRKALKKRGLDPDAFVSSPFHVRELPFYGSYYGVK